MLILFQLTSKQGYYHLNECHEHSYDNHTDLVKEIEHQRRIHFYKKFTKDVNMLHIKKDKYVAWHEVQG